MFIMVVTHPSVSSSSQALMHSSLLFVSNTDDITMIIYFLKLSFQSFPPEITPIKYCINLFSYKEGTAASAVSLLTPVELRAEYHTKQSTWWSEMKLVIMLAGVIWQNIQKKSML